MNKYFSFLHDILIWTIINFFCLISLVGMSIFVRYVAPSYIDKVDFSLQNSNHDLLVQECFRGNVDSIKNILINNPELREGFFARGYGALFSIFLKQLFFLNYKNVWADTASGSLLQGIVYRVTRQPSLEEYVKKLYGTRVHLEEIVPVEQRGAVIKEWLTMLKQIGIVINWNEGESFLHTILSFGFDAFIEFSQTDYFKAAMQATFLILYPRLKESKESRAYRRDRGPLLAFFLHNRQWRIVQYLLKNNLVDPGIKTELGHSVLYVALNPTYHQKNWGNSEEELSAIRLLLEKLKEAKKLPSSVSISTLTSLPHSLLNLLREFDVII